MKKTWIVWLVVLVVIVVVVVVLTSGTKKKTETQGKTAAAGPKMSAIQLRYDRLAAQFAEQNESGQGFLKKQFLGTAQLTGTGWVTSVEQGDAGAKVMISVKAAGGSPEITATLSAKGAQGQPPAAGQKVEFLGTIISLEQTDAGLVAGLKEATLKPAAK